jgi:hypothetical protein
MNDQDKLRVLIPHWIEHNREHAAEFERWADVVELVSPEIRTAAITIQNANLALTAALSKLGGPLDDQEFHHHHHHHQEEEQ